MTPVVAFLAGTLTWSLLEYVIHRFLGHLPSLRPNPFASEHVRHHSEGNYFAPSWKKVGAATLVTLALLLPLRVSTSDGLAFAYVGGLMSLYTAYEVLHRRLHTHAGIGWYGRWARRHHFAHHYADSRFNHGVTTPLWDVVFRTFRPVATIRVPSRFVMPWLKDPASGLVRPEFSDTFFIA